MDFILIFFFQDIWDGVGLLVEIASGNNYALCDVIEILTKSSLL